MSNFLTKAKFSKKVEQTVMEKRLSYIDSVVHICEQQNIEPEDVKKFLTKQVKEKIEAEAKALNYLPKGNELPV
jgi:cell division ATPase FtsA